MPAAGTHDPSASQSPLHSLPAQSGQQTGGPPSPTPQQRAPAGHSARLPPEEQGPDASAMHRPCTHTAE